MDKAKILFVAALALCMLMPSALAMSTNTHKTVVDKYTYPNTEVFCHVCQWRSPEVATWNFFNGGTKYIILTVRLQSDCTGASLEKGLEMVDKPRQGVVNRWSA